MVAEFDYQWKNLASPHIEYTPERIKEFLAYVRLTPDYFPGKKCLDAGCGNGRWTYAMKELGALVDSIDLSPEAIEKARTINPDAKVFNILDLIENRVYDFVLCWGVLHHLPDTLTGFRKVSSQVKPGGIFHIMVYHRKTQKIYQYGREKWPVWNEEEKKKYCEEMVTKNGGDVHGWWDAFNPKYNWSYSPREVKKWFKEAGFKDVKLTQKYSINMRGTYIGNKAEVSK